MIVIRKFKVAYYWAIVFNERVAFESDNLYASSDAAESAARDRLRSLSLEIEVRKAKEDV